MPGSEMANGSIWNRAVTRTDVSRTSLGNLSAVRMAYASRSSAAAPRAMSDSNAPAANRRIKGRRLPSIDCDKGPSGSGLFVVGARLALRIAATAGGGIAHCASIRRCAYYVPVVEFAAVEAADVAAGSRSRFACEWHQRSQEKLDRIRRQVMPSHHQRPVTARCKTPSVTISKKGVTMRTVKPTYTFASTATKCFPV
jgi:hypothetical protein